MPRFIIERSLPRGTVLSESDLRATSLKSLDVLIHFRDAVEQGLRHGRQIGKRAVNLFLRPVHHERLIDRYDRAAVETLHEHHAVDERLEQIGPDEGGAAFAVRQDDEPGLAVG